MRTLPRNGPETVIHFTRALIELIINIWILCCLKRLQEHFQNSYTHTNSHSIPEMCNFIKYPLKHDMWMETSDEQIRINLKAEEGAFTRYETLAISTLSAPKANAIASSLIAILSITSLIGIPIAGLIIASSH